MLAGGSRCSEEENVIVILAAFQTLLFTGFGKGREFSQHSLLDVNLRRGEVGVRMSGEREMKEQENE
jgi:hypothetical protein